MAVSRSPGSSPSTVAVLSPRQFHDRVEETLWAAIGAGDGAGREEALRRLSGILREVPSLSPRESQPHGLPLMLVDGTRNAIQRRCADAIARPELLLADLVEFVLAFYPEAAPPPQWSEPAGGPL